MGRDDNKGNGKNNPWGKPGNDDGRPRRNAPHGGGFGGGGEPPDLDDVLRKAQDSVRDVLPGNFHGTPLIIIAIIGITLLWLSSGIFFVQPGEHAVIQRFGAWSRTQVDPGPGYHFPSPIETAAILNVEEIKRMNIGFVESYSRNGSSARRDIPEESLILTSDRNIVDLDLVIQWNIKSAEDFLFEIRDQENTIKKVAESAIREVVGQTDMFPIITTGRAAVADAAKLIIQENLDEYKSGVNITQVLIERAEVHPDVQSAFQDVQSAKQDAEDVQNRAGAYREDILPKARGEAIKMMQQAEAYKQSTIARANGDADRFNSVYTAYLKGKDVTKERIFIETMEDVLKNAQKIILDKNSSEGVVPYLPLNSLQEKKKKRTQTMNKPLLIILALVAVSLISASQIFFIVDQREQAIILQLGKPIGDINNPGLHTKIPFFETVRYFDKRILSVDPKAEQVVISSVNIAKAEDNAEQTAEEKEIARQSSIANVTGEPIILDTFARYKIIDPLQFMKTLRTIRDANSRIENILNDATRAELGNTSLQQLLSPGRAFVMQNILQRVNSNIKKDNLGIEIVDVRIVRADLTAELRQSTVRRMISELKKRATETRAKGEERALEITSTAEKERTVIIAEAQRDSSILKGSGDKESIKVYANAFNKDKEFYSFIRSMEAYKKTLSDPETQLILSPDSSFFKHFSK